MLRDSQNRGKMLLALNKAFLYLNCQPRIFRKVPQASLSVCTKNYAPVYKHGWMQNHKRTGPNSTLPRDPPHSTSRTSSRTQRGWFAGDGARGDSTRNSKATGREEREEEEEEATAAAGVRKGGRTPHLSWLSHPAGQVGGEDQEECGAQSQGLGAGAGSLLKNWKTRFPGKRSRVLSLEAPLKAQD